MSCLHLKQLVTNSPWPICLLSDESISARGIDIGRCNGVSTGNGIGQCVGKGIGNGVGIGIGVGIGNGVNQYVIVAQLLSQQYHMLHACFIII